MTLSLGMVWKSNNHSALDITVKWKINDKTADYVDDFSNTRKSYRINSL